MMRTHTIVAMVLSVATGLSGCGAVREKTAPCRRPASLSSYAEDPRHDCGAMHEISGPAAAFAAIGIVAAE